MSYTTMPKGFLSLCVAVFTFSFIIQVNFYEIFNFLRLKGLSRDEIDHIEVMEVLSAIIGGVILTQIIGRYHRKTILLVSLVVYFICLINLHIFNYDKIFIPNRMLAYLSQFIFYSVALIKFIGFFKKQVAKALTVYFVLWICAAISAEYFVRFMKNVEVYHIFILLTIIQGFTIIIIYFLVERTRSSIVYQPYFVSLLKAIELETLAGFLVTYIAFSLYWDYEVFATNIGYSILKVEEARLYIIYGVLTALYPVKLLVNSVNKYKLNIYLILVFIIDLTILKLFGINKYCNMAAHFMNGAIIYTLFINNLVIITDKFVEEELDYAIAIYLSVSIIGSYIGIIATDSMMGTYGIFGFLISLYSVAVVFLLYYLLQFFSQRLYKQ